MSEKEKAKELRKQILAEIHRLNCMIMNPDAYKLEDKNGQPRNINFNDIDGMKKEVKRLSGELEKLPKEEISAGFRTLYPRIRLEAKSSDCPFYLEKSKDTLDKWIVKFDYSRINYYPLDPRVECNAQNKPIRVLYETANSDSKVLTSHSTIQRITYYIDLEVMDYSEPESRPEVKEVIKEIVIEKPVVREPEKPKESMVWICKHCGNSNYKELLQCRICSSPRDIEASKNLGINEESEPKKNGKLSKLKGLLK